jgi:hypothetical protein
MKVGSLISAMRPYTVIGAPSIIGACAYIRANTDRICYPTYLIIILAHLIIYCSERASERGLRWPGCGRIPQPQVPRHSHPSQLWLRGNFHYTVTFTTRLLSLHGYFHYTVTFTTRLLSLHGYFTYFTLDDTAVVRLLPLHGYFHYTITITTRLLHYSVTFTTRLLSLQGNFYYTVTFTTRLLSLHGYFHYTVTFTTR